MPFIWLAILYGVLTGLNKGAFSLYKVWNEARKEAEEKLKNADGFITALKVKRTALRKTIALLSAKNDFKEFTDMLYINGQNFEDAVAYGEIDLDSPDKFKLYNKGRLDCLPSIAVTTKIEEIYYLLKDKTIKDKVFAVFSTLEKFDEIISNPDTFILSCLQGIWKRQKGGCTIKLGERSAQVFL